MGILTIPLSFQDVTIREFEPSDFESIHRYASHPLVSEFQAWGPNDENDSRTFLQQMLLEQRQIDRTSYTFAIISGEQNLVGGAGIVLDSNNTANIGLSLHPDFWGKGIGFKCLKLLIFFCRNKLMLSKLTATADIQNVRSIALLKKVGFVYKITIENERQIRGRWRTTVVLELSLPSVDNYLKKLNSLSESQISAVIKKCSPISLLQKNILLHHSQIDNNSSYNLGWCWKIPYSTSPLSVDLAFNQLLNKHTILRCLLTEAKDLDNERLLKMPPMLAKINLVTTLDLSQSADDILKTHYSNSFNLYKEFPIRCFLIWTSSELYLQVLIHHAFIDGAGLGLLKKDFFSLLINPNPSTDIKEDNSYFSYIDNEIEEQKHSQAETDLNFWTNYYRNFEPTRLFSVANNQFGQAQTISQSVDSKIVNSLSYVMSQTNIVDFPIYQLALEMTVAQYFKSLSFAIGTTSQLRDNEAFAESVGPLINTLKIKGDIDLEKTISKSLTDLNDEFLEILAHQKMPYLSVLEKTKNRAAKEPFQIVLEFQRLIQTDEQTSFPEVESAQRTAKFPLNIFIFHQGKENIDITLEFDSSIITSAMACKILQIFQQALGTIARNWNSSESLFKILEFKPATLSGPSLPIIESIAEKIKSLSQRKEIILQDSSSSLSGQHVFEQASLFAYQINEKYCDADVIAIEEERSTAFICKLLGIWMAGKSFHVLNKTMPLSLKQSQLKISGAQLFNDPAIYYFQKKENKPGYIMFSSGTTGTPKGIKIQESSILNLSLSLQNILGNLSIQSCLLNASFTFDASIQQLILFLNGMRLYILSDDERLDFSLWPQLIENYQIDLIDCTPTQAKELCSVNVFSKESRLKVALIGGEKIDSKLLSQLKQSSVKSFNVYGPCECTVDVTSMMITNNSKIGELGKPFPNIRIDIVNKNGTILPLGFSGEIKISGNQVATGYLEDPDNLKFKDKSYRTGDLGFIDQFGSIHYLGRQDLQIKRAGVRIELDSITSICNQHDQVQDSHAYYEPISEKIYLAVKVKDLAEISSETIHLFIKDYLPSYALPDQIIRVTNFPCNRSGKIDWNDLIKHAQLSQQSKPQLELSETESILLSIWNKIIDRNIIEIDKNFFDIGGDSLSAFKAVMSIRSQFKIPFSMADFIEHPSIQSIAKKIEKTKLSPLEKDNLFQVKVLKKATTLSAPILVIFHPVGGNLASYQALVKSLIFSGTIIGVSASEIGSLTRPYNLSAYVEKMLNYVRTFIGKNPCFLLGWSFGGMLALEFEKKYRNHFDFKGLILIDTHLNPEKKMDTDRSEILRSAVYPFLKERTALDITFPELGSHTFETSASNIYLNAFARLQKKYSELSDINSHEFLKLIEQITYFRSLVPTFDFTNNETGVDTFIFDADQVTNNSVGRINIRAGQKYKTIKDVIPGDHFSIVESSLLSQKINSIWGNS